MSAHATQFAQSILHIELSVRSHTSGRPSVSVNYYIFSRISLYVYYICTAAWRQRSAFHRMNVLSCVWLPSVKFIMFSIHFFSLLLLFLFNCASRAHIFQVSSFTVCFAFLFSFLFCYCFCCFLRKCTFLCENLAIVVGVGVGVGSDRVRRRIQKQTQTVCDLRRHRHHRDGWESLETQNCNLIINAVRCNSKSSIWQCA